MGAGQHARPTVWPAFLTLANKRCRPAAGPRRTCPPLNHRLGSCSAASARHCRRSGRSAGQGEARGSWARLSRPLRLHVALGRSLLQVKILGSPAIGQQVLISRDGEATPANMGRGGGPVGFS